MATYIYIYYGWYKITTEGEFSSVPLLQISTKPLRDYKPQLMAVYSSAQDRAGNAMNCTRLLKKYGDYTLSIGTLTSLNCGGQRIQNKA